MFLHAVRGLWIICSTLLDFEDTGLEIESCDWDWKRSFGGDQLWWRVRNPIVYRTTLLWLVEETAAA